MRDDGDIEYIGVLEKLLRDQQRYLWDDLNNHLHNARNGYWSIACQGTIQRIWEIAKVMGFTPPGEIQIPLLSSGVYYAVLDKVGKKYEELDLAGYEDHFHTNEAWADETTECIKTMEIE